MRQCQNGHPQVIPLDDLVPRHDLDPRLGDRDDDLIEQYAEIFDVLPPIEMNQDKEVIDGWHRCLAARRGGVVEIAYVVETRDDNDLADRMWEANRKHGVQYTRGQRKAYGVKLHGRGLSAKEIAERAGVNITTVRRWTKSLRERDRQRRNQAVVELAEQGKTQAEIAEETGVPQSTESDILTENMQMREIDKADEPPENTAPQPDSEAAALDGAEPEVLLDESREQPQPEPKPKGLASAPKAQEVEEELVAELAAESEPEPIPDDILNIARAVMGTFAETRPDGYVAKLEVSEGEWMTITDGSLSNELERELLTSAAAMCLWQEQMIWYQGERTSSFTDAFGKIGPVFVRGLAGQCSIVSKLRSTIRRLWT